MPLFLLLDLLFPLGLSLDRGDMLLLFGQKMAFGQDRGDGFLNLEVLNEFEALGVQPRDDIVVKDL